MSRYSTLLRTLPSLLLYDVDEVMMGRDSLTLIIPSSLWLTIIRGVERMRALLSVSLAVTKAVRLNSSGLLRSTVPDEIPVPPAVVMDALENILPTPV